MEKVFLEPLLLKSHCGTSPCNKMGILKYSLRKHAHTFINLLFMPRDQFYSNFVLAYKLLLSSTKSEYKYKGLKYRAKLLYLFFPGDSGVLFAYLYINDGNVEAFTLEILFCCSIVDICNICLIYCVNTLMLFVLSFLTLEIYL